MTNKQECAGKKRTSIWLPMSMLNELKKRKDSHGASMSFQIYQALLKVGYPTVDSVEDQEIEIQT